MSTRNGLSGVPETELPDVVMNVVVKVVVESICVGWSALAVGGGDIAVVSNKVGTVVDPIPTLMVGGVPSERTEGKDSFGAVVSAVVKCRGMLLIG